MRLVLVNHFNNAGQFLFRIPGGFDIRKDDIVKVKTKAGKTYGIAIENSFEINDEAQEANIRKLCNISKNAVIQPVLNVYVGKSIYSEDSKEEDSI